MNTEIRLYFEPPALKGSLGKWHVDTFKIGHDGPQAIVTDYPQAWVDFWDRWGSIHSTLRCPGNPCPGGCGATAQDELRSLVLGWALKRNRS